VRVFDLAALAVFDQAVGARDVGRAEVPCCIDREQVMSVVENVLLEHPSTLNFKEHIGEAFIETLGVNVVENGSMLCVAWNGFDRDSSGSCLAAAGRMQAKMAL
jgi:hypothetical protein